VIHVTLTGLLVAYLLLILGGVSGLWVVSEVNRARRIRRLRKTYVICRNCGNHYRDATSAMLVVCPECGRVNERETIREI